MKSFLLSIIGLFCFILLVNSQSSQCAYKDPDTGYELSWTAGVGFLDFFLFYKDFPTRAAHWLAVGFGNESSKMALIDTQYGRVSVASASLYDGKQPLKLPRANMVTRGYGSLDSQRLRASFSMPIYYFERCDLWSFFTVPTQTGMSYEGHPKTKKVCNVTELCAEPRIPSKYRSYPSTSSANFNINGNIRINSDPDGSINVQLGTQDPSNPQYNQQYYNSEASQSNQQNQLGNNQQMYNQQLYSPQSNGYQQPYGNPPSQSQPYQSDQSQFTVDNPNYKFLPDQLGYRYQNSASEHRFYDSNGTSLNTQTATTTETPFRTNAEQNKINFEDIQNGIKNGISGVVNWTNNVFGYDYRSNPNMRYTYNGNEAQYQPPQYRQNPGGRKKRQSRFDGTAYSGQDRKFSRVENTIPNMYSDSPNLNRIEPGRQLDSGMYYPYRTAVGFQPSNAEYGTYTSNTRFNNDQLYPRYVQNSATTDSRGYIVDYEGRYVNGNPGNPFIQNPSQYGSGTRQFDAQTNIPPNSDPTWCRTYVKTFKDWFITYGGKAGAVCWKGKEDNLQNICSSLRDSLKTSDHQCRESSAAIGC